LSEGRIWAVPKATALISVKAIAGRNDAKPGLRAYEFDPDNWRGLWANRVNVAFNPSPGAD